MRDSVKISAIWYCKKPRQSETRKKAYVAISNRLTRRRALVKFWCGKVDCADPRALEEFKPEGVTIEEILLDAALRRPRHNPSE